MRQYFFGYLFVKLAKVFAILLLVAGVCGAIFQYREADLDAASIRYESSSTLLSRFSDVNTKWSQMAKIVSEFPGHPQLVASQLSSIQAPNKQKDFEDLRLQLSIIGNQKSVAKAFIVRAFEDEVGKIEQKLRTHAAELARELAPPSNPKPSSNQNDRPAENADAYTPTLFEEISRENIIGRRNSLNESRDFLSSLQAITENPENGQILGRALTEIKRLERLLPSRLEPPPVTRKTAEKEEIRDPAAQFDAARVADQLQYVRQLVRLAVLSDWAIDSALESAESTLSSENKKFIESDRLLKRMWLTVCGHIIIVLLSAAISAFLVLVLADVTQTFLDTAVHTSIMASAFQNREASEDSA